MIWQIFHGFCMALADSVPGVSGGTVAYILGFYERFIGALNDLFSGSMRERRAALLYLAKLGIGWVVGMVASMLVLNQLFERNIYFLTSVFLGLTCAALPFVAAEEKDAIKGHGRNWPFFIVGLVLVCGMVVVRDVVSSSVAIHFNALSLFQYAHVFISGALAISAMVLPGVSGSTVLLITGVYIPTISAVSNVLHLKLEFLPGLLALVGGIICGAAISVRFLKKALAHHRSPMVFFILGLMAGSLYAIMMGPTTMNDGQAPLTLDTFSILAFLIGIGILIILERIKIIGQRREAEMEELLKS